MGQARGTESALDDMKPVAELVAGESSVDAERLATKVIEAPRRLIGYREGLLDRCRVPIS